MHMAQVVSGQSAARHLEHELKEIAEEELEHRDEPAERAAIAVYQKLAEKTFGKDPVTYNLMVHILEKEVEHAGDFESLLH